MKRDDDDEQPKILSARFGVNPNSSSLGVDVTFLIFGGAATLAATLLLSVLLRSKKGKAEVHGDEAIATGGGPPGRDGAAE